MTDQINVGLIGYGFAGRTFHAPLIAAIPGLRLATIASSDPARVRADWPAIDVVPTPAALFARPDLELVVVATPNQTHYPLAREALAAGKHVVVDKPFTVTLEEAVDLCDRASQAHRLLAVFHNRRWDSDFLTARRLLASGQLGRVVHLESHFDRFRPVVRARWRELPGPGSGVWFDLGPHLLDQALQLFGLPEALSCDLASQRDAAATDDYFHVQLRYGAQRVILHAGSLVAAAGPRLIIHGTAGSYVKYGLDPQEEALRSGIHPPTANWGADPHDGLLTLYSEGTTTTRPLPTVPGNYPAFYQGVLDAIRGAAPNPVPATEAALVMTLLHLAVRSSEERRELPVVADG